MDAVKRLALAFAIAAFAPLAHAEPAVPIRTEVPVKEVVLSDGTRRYAVPIKVGATGILAGLDTGSTGLRVLPNVLQAGETRPTSQGDSYSYQSGARLDGQVADASVTVGELSGEATVQAVQRVGCTDTKPNCPAGRIPLAQYGIQGNGLPGEGFKAILGVNMAKADVASLFSAIGAQRWIVELPRPGEGKPGRIVLNPTDEEAQGFISLPIMDQYAALRGGAHDAVEGCLVNDATRARLCGAVILDTGAPGIEVIGADIPRSPWPNDTPATLTFADASGHVKAGERFVIGRREHASHLIFQQRDRMSTPMILSGLTSYFAYAILYDPAHGTVGFKPRPPTANGPIPVAAN